MLDKIIYTECLKICNNFNFCFAKLIANIEMKNTYLLAQYFDILYDFVRMLIIKIGQIFVNIPYIEHKVKTSST